MTSSVPSGLRDRKKQATRAAISHAAWSLMLEQGLRAVTAESVAARADVAPRTFRNYFSSREAAVVEASLRRVELIAEAVRDRPVGEPVWDSLAHVLPETLAAVVSSREDVAMLTRVSKEHPAVRAQQQAAFDRIGQQLEEVIAERLGDHPERDLAARLLAAAARAVITVSIETWTIADSQTCLPDIVREVISQLRTGIPLGSADLGDGDDLP